jgi:hypothetical protein
MHRASAALQGVLSVNTEPAGAKVRLNDLLAIPESFLNDGLL